MKSLVYSAILSLTFLFAMSCNPNSETDPNGEGTAPDMDSASSGKMVVYQVFTRLFGNTETANETYGTKETNGVGKFNDFTDTGLEEIRKMGVTHIWYTGVLEHATMTDYSDHGIPADDADVVKGRAGSPYAIKDYYDVSPDLAQEVPNRMAEWEALVDRSHNAGLKVVMDFVPNHVARSYASDVKPEGVKDLGQDDDNTVSYAHSNNFYYLPGTTLKVPEDNDPLDEEEAPNEDGKYTETPAKVTGNNVFSHEPKIWDWFETVKLNYGIEYTDSGEVKHFDPTPDTWTKMRDILLFWADKGIDAFRCDMAEMVPVEFWSWVIPEIKKVHSDIVFIAEIYNPKSYEDYAKEGGFDYLYDKVGVYDTIRELMSGEGKTSKIMAALAQSDGFEEQMLRFLENHDEQRIASKEFAGTPWAAVPGMTVSALMGQGPVMIYFGQESGEPGDGIEGFQKDDGRTTIFDYWGVPEHQKWVNGGKFDGGGLSEDQQKLRAFYKALIYICRYEEAIEKGSFVQFPIQDEQVYAFGRHTDDHHVIVIANFSATDAKTYELHKDDLNVMGVEGKETYIFSDLLWSENDFEINGGDAFGANGYPIEIPAYGAQVYSVEVK